MAKIDLKKELKHLYRPSPREVTVVDVPPMNFLMIDGSGDPNTSAEYKEALEALYALAYALKFRVKRSQGVDYVVMPLEGLWWVEGTERFSWEDKESWQWTAMIMQPEWVTVGMFEEVREEVERKKPVAALGRVRFERFEEGLSVQILHIGPYSAEGPTVEKLQTFIRESGYRVRGRHHEIYLSDPRRCAPERLRTVIRQPIAVG